MIRNVLNTMFLCFLFSAFEFKAVDFNEKKTVVSEENIIIPTQSAIDTIAEKMYNSRHDTGEKKSKIESLKTAFNQAKEKLDFKSSTSFSYIQFRRLVNKTFEVYRADSAFDADLFTQFFTNLLTRNQLKENLEALKHLKNDPISALSNPAKERGRDDLKRTRG